jgi:hypothetical protein
MGCTRANDSSGFFIQDKAVRRRCSLSVIPGSASQSSGHDEVIP